MKLHERVMIVQGAHNEMAKAVIDVVEKHGLTYLELLACLNDVSASWLKYAIRNERHPDDPEKRGGES
jgi:hypothetical protein